jgi:hypothetical protein
MIYVTCAFYFTFKRASANLWRQGFGHPTRNECMGWFAQVHFRGGEDLREMPLIIVVKPRDFVDVFNDSRLDTRRFTSDSYLTSLRLVMDMCVAPSLVVVGTNINLQNHYVSPR